MPGRRPKKKSLTDLELEVMHVVWDAEPEALTVREVVDRLNAARRQPFAYTTIQTMMGILKRKGVVTSSSGTSRAHRYAAKAKRDDVTTSMVGDFVDRMFRGEARPLLFSLLDHESLDREHLEELKRSIETQLDEEQP